MHVLLLLPSPSGGAAEYHAYHPLTLHVIAPMLTDRDSPHSSSAEPHSTPSAEHSFMITNLQCRSPEQYVTPPLPFVHWTGGGDSRSYLTLQCLRGPVEPCRAFRPRLPSLSQICSLYVLYPMTVIRYTHLWSCMMPGLHARRGGQ